jgi:hypothetical protein
MQTVNEIPAPRKPAKAFYAHLFMDSGALVKVGGTLYFVGDDGAIVEVEPGMVNFLTVLGEMTLADAQRIEDLMAGGAASVACGRQMLEV